MNRQKIEDLYVLYSLCQNHKDCKKQPGYCMKIHKKCTQFIIKNASHNVHIENNEYFIDTINNILRLVS